MRAPDLSALGAPTDGAELVFAEPWEALAFALAVELNARGAFTWTEWAAALADEIRKAPDTPYYENWLAALEAVTKGKGLADSTALAERKTAWEEAYRNTPHGKPVELHRSMKSA